MGIECKNSIQYKNKFFVVESVFLSYIYVYVDLNALINVLLYLVNAFWIGHGNDFDCHDSHNCWGIIVGGGGDVFFM